MLKRLLFTAFAVTFSSLAASHDVWLEPGTGAEHRLVFGHPGDLEPYEPARVTSVSVVDVNGGKSRPETRVDDGHLVVKTPAGASVIAVVFDNGIWTEGPDEQLVNEPKHAVPGYNKSSHTKNFSKALLAWGDAARKPIGMDLEVVPLDDPFGLKPGQELIVQVFHGGKPLAGAEVEMLGAMDLFFTDEQGKVRLPVSDESFQYVLVMHRVPLKDNPDTDELELQANLTFAL